MLLRRDEPSLKVDDERKPADTEIQVCETVMLVYNTLMNISY